MCRLLDGRLPQVILLLRILTPQAFLSFLCLIWDQWSPLSFFCSPSLSPLDDPDEPGSGSWRLALRPSCRPGCSNCLVCSCCRRPSWNLGFCCEEWKFHHFQQNWSKYHTLSKSQSISHFLPQYNNLAAKLTRLDFLFSADHLHFPKSYQNLILSSISV